MTVSITASTKENVNTPLSMPHPLSRQPSKEDLELAANLNLLNSSEGRHAPTIKECNNRKQEPKQATPNKVADGLREEVSDHQSNQSARMTEVSNESSPAVQSISLAEVQEHNQRNVTTPIMGQTCR